MSIGRGTVHVAAVRRCREDDARVADQRVGPLRGVSAVGPRHVDPAGAVNRHRLEAVGPERRQRGRLVERAESGHAHRLAERRAAVGRAHDEHRVVLRARPETPPGHVNGPIVRADGDLRILDEARSRTEIARGAPGGAAVGRSREHDRRLLRGTGPREGRVRDIDVPRRDRLRHDRAGGIAEWHVEAAGGGRARDVGGQRHLVQEAPAGVTVGNPRVEVDDRIARLEVVHVLVARDEDGARRVVAPVERDPGEIEHAVGAGAHERIGGGVIAPERRGVGGILWISGQQRALPVLTAVERLEKADPGVGVHPLRAEQIRRMRDVDRAVVVDAGEDVERVARRDRARRFVLTLQVGIAVGKRRARDDVDVRRPARSAVPARRRQRRGLMRGRLQQTTSVATDQIDACTPCAAVHGVAERLGSLSAGVRACEDAAPGQLPIPMPRVTGCRVLELMPRSLRNRRSGSVRNCTLLRRRSHRGSRGYRRS